MRKPLIPIAAAALIVATLIGLAPTVQATHGAVIVNTRISSSIIDGRGAAFAVAPLACGIDSTVWCEVASSIDANK